MMEIIIKLFLSSFQQLDSSYLKGLPTNEYYSDQTKEELIKELTQHFSKLKKEGETNLTVKLSECFYCYPNSPVLKGYNTNKELVISYVVTKNKDQYIAQSCTNKPVPDGENNIPF